MARTKTKKRAAGSKRRTTPQRKKLLFVPYPLIIFLLLCAGVLLVAWTIRAGAASLDVTAQIKAPPIAGSPTINTIYQGERIGYSPIYIGGICPPKAAYVEIYRNGIMAGSAICFHGKYDPYISLVPGKNLLQARASNITDDLGPVSGAITIYYTGSYSGGGSSNRGSGSSGSGSSGSGSKVAAPLLLKTAFVYKGYYVGQAVDWPLALSGGTAPYALNVNWGDGQNSIISRAKAGQFDITHQYQKPGSSPNNSYTIKVQASDAHGDYSYLEFFVIVNKQGAAGAGSIYSKGPPSLGGASSWLWVAWPLYLSVFLMAISFKLGEREEFLILRRHRRQH